MFLCRMLPAVLAAITMLPVGAAGAVPPETPRVVLAMSAWAGFAPIALAEQAGYFARRGVAVELRLMAQPERWAAMRDGRVQAVAGTLDALIVGAARHDASWPAVVVLARSAGGDGIAARATLDSLGALRGRSIAVDRPGTTPFFVAARALRAVGRGPAGARD